MSTARIIPFFSLKPLSDNVVRAGLTPKWKDTHTLCDMLTYACGPTPVQTGTAIDSVTRQYAAPVPEFTLQRTELVAAGPETTPTPAYALPAAPSAAIIVVVEGEALAVCTTLDGSVTSTQVSTAHSEIFVYLCVCVCTAIEREAGEGTRRRAQVCVDGHC